MNMPISQATTHVKPISRLAAIVFATVALTLSGCGGGDEDAENENVDDPTLQPWPEEEGALQDEEGTQMMERYPERTMPGAPGGAGSAAKQAVASISPVGNGSVEGELSLTANGGVRIEGRLTGLEPGKHGFHIHQNGDCGGERAAAAGGHFNPADNPHGSPNDDTDEHHAGDFGNIVADSDGVAVVSLSDSAISLDDPSTGVAGRAIVIHSGEDDLSSQPSGDAGDPVGCGVIELVGETSAQSGDEQS